MTDSENRSPAETVLLGSVAGFAMFVPMSIAAAQIALGVAIVAAMATRRRPRMSPLIYPALAYSFATLVAATLSPQPLFSLADTKQLLLNVILVLIPIAVTNRAAAGLVRDAFLVGSAISATLAGFIYVNTVGGLVNRVSGPASHYMTLGGLLMLAAVVATTEVLVTRSTRRRIVVGAALFLFVAALAASYTRNAWLGLLVGATVAVISVRPRLVVVLAIATALVVAIAPAPIRERMLSINFAANEDRVEMIEVGMSMVAAHPLFGVGPNRIPAAYAEYPSTRVQPHLHNNLLQIAAERGLLAVTAWLWLIAAIAATAYRGSKRERDSARHIAAMAAVAALFVAGLFEYNYGDSEVQMAFLMLASLTAELPAEESGA